MEISKNGIELIKRFEGYRAKAYLCPAGVWTIGYGHTNHVQEGDVTNETGAEALLREDLQWAERAVNGLHVRLRQGQYDALVSLTFNIGSGNLKKYWAEVLKRNPDDPALADKFRAWNKGGGKVLPGLVARREAELNLYYSEV